MTNIDEEDAGERQWVKEWKSASNQSQATWAQEVRDKESQGRIL